MISLGWAGRLLGTPVRVLSGGISEGEIWDDYLKEVLGVLEILELVSAQIAQARNLGQAVLNQLVRGLREKDLTPMTGCADACRPVDIEADVASSAEGGLAGVQSHAHPERLAHGPGVSGQAPLGSHRRRDSVSGPIENDKEGVARCINFLPVPLLEGAPQKPPLLQQHFGVLVTKLLQQARRALDVAEEKRHRPSRALVPLNGLLIHS